MLMIVKVVNNNSLETTTRAAHGDLLIGGTKALTAKVG
jgi:hypothetical protein